MRIPLVRSIPALLEPADKYFLSFFFPPSFFPLCDEDEFIAARRNAGNQYEGKNRTRSKVEFVEMK